MSIYKDLLFLDGFRVPAEYVEDVDAARRVSAPEPAAAPRSERRATAPRWRRMLRGVAAAAGVATPGASWGRCG